MACDCTCDRRTRSAGAYPRGHGAFDGAVDGAGGERVTELQGVVSLSWVEVEFGSGLGEDAVDQLWTVLDLAWAAADGGDQVVGVGERGVGELAPQQGPDPLDGVEVRAVGRELVDGEPLVRLDELPHAPGQVSVEVVPDDYEWAAELGVCGDQQVAVVVPGEAFAPVGASVGGGPVG